MYNMLPVQKDEPKRPKATFSIDFDFARDLMEWRKVTVNHIPDDLTRGELDHIIRTLRLRCGIPEEI